MEAVGRHMVSINPIPKNVCEFCGKPLIYHGLIHPFKNDTVLIWRAKPESCNCKQAQEVQRRKVEEEKEREQHLRKMNHSRNVRQLMLNSGIPPRLQQYSMSGYNITEFNKKAYQTTEKYIANLQQHLSDGTGICFVGNCGVGKTFLAACIAKAVIEQEIFALYQNISGLYRELKQSFSATNMTEDDVINKYVSVPLLVLDDVGKELPSDWKLSTLYELINRRTDEMKPTIYTTNYSNLDLKSRFQKGGDESTAAATVERMMDTHINDVILIHGNSHRGKFKGV